MNDAEYYGRRALHEAHAAKVAVCDASRQSHARLAEQLRLKAEELCRVSAPARPQLQLRLVS